MKNRTRVGGPFCILQVASMLTLRRRSRNRGLSPLQEVVREIRVHGNAAIADAEVLKIAGIAVDAPLGPDGLAAIERRLKASGWFETVEVRKRYRSLTDATDVALVLIVHEKADGHRLDDDRRSRSARSRAGSPAASCSCRSSPTRTATASPTARDSAPNDLLGLGERLSVPLTWGGTRRAALGAGTHVQARTLHAALLSAAICQRENPGFVLEG